MNPRVFANIYFNGGVKGHGTYSDYGEYKATRVATHYTMARQRNRQMRFKKLHPWRVTPAEAREIQENLRARWEGEDRLPQIKTIAGLDAAFLLVGSQALKKKTSRWNALREANRAI